ncbi:hypothetical protein T09_13806 [Trichinella sp. T9]|nr:hypothetical protein T09_13806 [Trichinella sp. T9]
MVQLCRRRFDSLGTVRSAVPVILYGVCFRISVGYTLGISGTNLRHLHSGPASRIVGVFSRVFSFFLGGYPLVRYDVIAGCLGATFVVLPVGDLLCALRAPFVCGAGCRLLPSTDLFVVIDSAASCCFQSGILLEVSL